MSYDSTVSLIRALRTPDEARAFVERRLGEYAAERADRERARLLRDAQDDGEQHRWIRHQRSSLWGMLALYCPVWTEPLVRDCLRQGGSQAAEWLGQNPALDGEAMRPLLRWIGWRLLTHARIRNRWIGYRFLTTERPSAFIALRGLAERAALPHGHPLLRAARLEARLLPGAYPRRRLLGAHPEDDAADLWRALRHVEGPDEAESTLRRGVRLLAGDDFRRAWLQLRAHGLEGAAEVLAEVGEEALGALEREDLLPLLASPTLAIREQALRAVRALLPQEETRPAAAPALADDAVAPQPEPALAAMRVRALSRVLRPVLPVPTPLRAEGAAAPRVSAGGRSGR
jgi:hypothetical protein